MSENVVLEKLAIREVIDNWAIWSDSGDWERFRTVWHEDGHMSATWFQGPAEEFLRVRRQGWERGVSILHFLGGSFDRHRREPSHCPDENDDFPAGTGT